MANTLKESESNVICGLGTFTFTVGVAGLFMIACQSTVVPTSSLSVVIEYNGTPIATSTAPTTAQGTIAIQTLQNCVVSDVISIVISSSAAIDNMDNTVKTIVALNRIH